MIDANRIDALLRELSVPPASPRAEDIRLMIDEAVHFVEATKSLHAEELSVTAVRETDEDAWIAIEPAHVTFYV